MIARLALVIGLTLGVGPVRADFVESNLRFTLYHELGHAVIDQLDLPIFGPEENAADSFAMVLAHRLLTEAEMTELITDVTALGRAEAAEEIFDPWDEYMPGPQRLARAICLYYGLNPETRAATARALGMAPVSQDDCAADAEAVGAAWRVVLDRLEPDDDGSQSLLPWRRGKALRLLSDDISRINASLALPQPVRVSQTNCGEDNAFYFEIEKRIEFCSEMVEALRARRP